jgi:phage terminase large subunit-like protein
MSTVYPSLEESKGNEGSIWLIGTIVHYDSALQAIYDGYLEAQEKNNKYTWDVIFHRALEDGKPLWASYFSKSKISEIRRDYENVGQLHKFSQEYMNDARDLATAKFKIDKLQHHDYEVVSGNNQIYLKNKNTIIPVNVYIGVDLAYESNANNDYQVIMVTAIDSEKNYYIIDYYHEHLPLYEMPQKIFEYAKMYNPVRRVNVEHVGAQGIIKDSVNKMGGFDRKMAPGIARGVRPPNGIKKEDRLESLLCPIVNRGKLFHRKIHQEVVDEMFHFPKGKNDDLLDGLWYSITNARSPLSGKFESDDFTAESNEEYKKSKKSVLRSWITGQRI